jgi:hypothetical protein
MSIEAARAPHRRGAPEVVYDTARAFAEARSSRMHIAWRLFGRPMSSVHK